VKTTSADLDVFGEAYGESSPYRLDNRLIMTWYPKRILVQTQGRSLLELGIGHGHTTTMFSERFGRHVVVEGSSRVIRRFREQHPENRTAVVHSLFEDFETDERFDVIVMGFVLEHVDDPHAILTKFRRFLSPGGVVFVAVPNAMALNKRYGCEAGLISDYFALSRTDLAQGHQRLYTVEMLTEEVRQARYEVGRVEGLYLKPLGTRQLASLDLSEDVYQAMMKTGVDYPELCVAILMRLELPYE